MNGLDFIFLSSDVTLSKLKVLNQYCNITNVLNIIIPYCRSDYIQLVDYWLTLHFQKI